MPSAYLWGYSATVLLAEATNAGMSQGAYTSFEPVASGRWVHDSTGTHRVAGGRTGEWAHQLDGTESLLRRNLPAGTYELVFWAKDRAAPVASAAGSALPVAAGATGAAHRDGVAAIPGHGALERVERPARGRASDGTGAGGRRAPVPAGQPHDQLHP